jgi:hypothetical protein
MTERLSDIGPHQSAQRRLKLAKWRMDQANNELERAEDEWRKACANLDALEEQPFVSGEQRKET